MTGVRASTFRARKPKCHRMKSSNFRIQVCESREPSHNFEVLFLRFLDVFGSGFGYVSFRCKEYLTRYCVSLDCLQAILSFPGVHFLARVEGTIPYGVARTY